MNEQDLQFEQEWSEQAKEEMEEFFDKRVAESNEHQEMNDGER